MASFTIGRIGAVETAHVTLEFIDRWRTRASARGTTDTIRGEAVTSNKTQALALANELTQMSGQIVAITFDEYAGRDGFYIVQDVSIDVSTESFADSAANVIPFDIDVEYIGTAQATKFESLIDGLLIANDGGVIDSEVKYTWSPPVGAEAVTDAGSPTGHTRTTVDGTVEVYVGVDVDLDPTWSVDPDSFYKGGARIELGGYTRTGTDAPEDLTGWKISTGIVDLFADGTNDGVVNLQSSVDETPYGFKIMFEESTAIPAWNYPNIIENTPAVCRISFTRDANESPPTDSLHYLEVIARRGCPFFTCRFVWTGAATTWAVDRESADAATGITPTGADGVMAVEDDADDADGNRWFIGGATHDSWDTVQGGLDWDGANYSEFVFFLGMEMGGSSANARDDTGDVMLQALGWVHEITRASRR